MPAEHMRKNPPRTAAEAEKTTRVPRAKKPTSAKIVPDGENWALPGASIPPGTDPYTYARGVDRGIAGTLVRGVKKGGFPVVYDETGSPVEIACTALHDAKEGEFVRCRAPRAKKPVPVLIFRDDTNRAISFAERIDVMSQEAKNTIMGHGQLNLAAGIRSLVAERDNLKQALTRVLMWAPRSTEAACEQDFEFARKTLANSRT